MPRMTAEIRDVRVAWCLLAVDRAGPAVLLVQHFF